MKPNLLKNVYATIAALFVAMFALPTTAQAQGTARIILEAHNVWQDGSGYQMLLDADHNLYGSKIPDKGPLWDNDNPPADLYDGFEYKIPTNADPSTKPKYMVVDGEAYKIFPLEFTISVSQHQRQVRQYGLQAMQTVPQEPIITGSRLAKPIALQCIYQKVAPTMVQS